MTVAHSLESNSPAIPARLGRYRILASLGQGGMAEVMVAVMPGPARFNKLLVIKTIRDDIESSGSEDFAQMFLDEARLAARLSHQNVVQTYEVGEHEGHHFIAMEFLEGQSLRHVQRRLTNHGLPLEARLRILINTAEGLHHAHELTDYSGNSLNVVHRDVSPQNIFLTYDGQVKLLDFGIAKNSDADAVTTVGHIKGKIDYMAPEQIKGDNIDRRADIFALGAILWEMLADRPLSGGSKNNQVTRVHNRVCNKEPNIRSVMPEIDEELAVICDKALAFNPDDRYATAQEFAQDLQGYLAERSLVPTAAQLGEVLRSAFAKERQDLRSRIERALAAMEDEEFVPVAMYDPHSVVSTTSGQQLLTSSTSGFRPLSTTVPPPYRAKKVSWFSRLGTVAAFAGVAAWLAMTVDLGPQADQGDPAAQEPSASAPVTPQAEPDPAPAPQAEPAPAPEVVRVKIVASPAEARVTLDGAELPTLPFEAELAKDNALHKLTASAPGHETVSQVLLFDRDREVSFELKPAPKPRLLAHKRRPRRRAVRRGGAAVATSALPAPAAAPQPSAPQPPAEPRPGDELKVDLGSKEPIIEDDPYQ